MRVAAGFSVAFLAALVAGCTSINATHATFEGTQWQVVAINDQATPRTDMYRVGFRDGQFGGRTGCNHFGGTYRVSGDVLTVGSVAATEMACDGPGGTFESWSFRVLQQPMRLTWHSAKRLTLSNPAGSIGLERLF